MKKDIILLDSIDDVSKINYIRGETKIIVFDYITHKKLYEKNIEHFFYDEYLSNIEIDELFDFIKSHSIWNEKIFKSSNLEFERVDILRIISPLEFHETFFPIFKKIYSIKNIIKTENPNHIHVSSNLKNFVEQFADHKIIEELSLPIRNLERGFNVEQIEIRFNILSKLVTIYLSKKLFSRLKSIHENVVCTFFNLWYKPNKSQKANLILELNPTLFSSLLSEFKDSQYAAVFLNQRRSAVWSWKSIQNLRKNGCKVINSEKFFDINKKTFENIKSKYELELEKFWKNDEKLRILFTKDDIQFWPVIKEKLIILYHSRLENYLKSIIISKNILNELNLNSILSLSESGENENIIYQYNNNKITTSLLQHSFFRYDEQLFDFQWRYELQAMYGLKSNYYFLWGNADYNFYSKYGIPKEKLIITGSVKHDNYFSVQKISKQKTVLLAVMPITNVSGLCRIQTYLDYEEMLNKILHTLKSIKNIKIIIKLHPGENFSNILLNQYFQLNHPDIPVLQVKPSKELIESSDILIHTGPEFYEVSTIMLEGMLLGKPVIDVYLNDDIKNLKPLDDGLLRISGKDNFEKITNVITDSNMSLKLRKSIPEQLKNYISFHPNACKNVCEFLENINHIK